VGLLLKIDDIARLANVSKSAVSLALNGKRGVSEETREKVLKIAQDHGYISRAIIKADQYYQTSSKILRFVACTNEGIVTDHYDTMPFFTELINCIDRHTDASGFSLIISAVKINQLYEEISRLEREQKSDGILLLGTNLSPEQIKLVAEVQPNLVVLDTCFNTIDINFVVMNNQYGGYQAAKHLMDLGHQNIGYVSSDTRMYNFKMREKGFFEALSENDLKIDKTNYYSLSPTLITSQDSFKEAIKNQKELPSALFCECDYIAISVLKSLYELGIKVPEDISIIGFDNIFESKVVTPELTTINVKKDQIASMAVEKLIKIINEEDTDKVKIFVDTELITRNSCQKLK
jgi:DNA-binding LacI/PurR family transcriptional regulator